MQLQQEESLPFRRLSFLKSEYERIWKPKLEAAKDIYPFEILSVEKGLREAATLHLKPMEIQKRVAALNGKGLFFTPIRWVKSFTGLGHRHFPASANDPEAVCYGVVTRDKKTGGRFKKASQDQTQHDILGGLLGYPSCCRKFFERVWGQGYIDPIWQQALNTGAKPERHKVGGFFVSVEGYKECVAFHRYWDVRVSFHLPCSFVCEATRQRSRVLLEEMKKYYPKAVTAITEILSLPASWDVYRGIALVCTPFFKGWANSVACDRLHTVYYSPLESPCG